MNIVASGERAWSPAIPRTLCSGRGAGGYKGVTKTQRFDNLLVCAAINTARGAALLIIGAAVQFEAL